MSQVPNRLLEETDEIENVPIKQENGCCIEVELADKKLSVVEIDVSSGIVEELA